MAGPVAATSRTCCVVRTPPETPRRRTGVLTDLQQRIALAVSEVVGGDGFAEGEIRHFGLCNVTEPELRRAQVLTPVVSVQNLYNVTDRKSESMIDLREQEQMVFLPWAPILDTGKTPRWQTSRLVTRQRRGRWCSPGSWPAHRRCYQSRAPARPATSRRRLVAPVSP
jgi:hypothetical protein